MENQQNILAEFLEKSSRKENRSAWAPVFLIGILVGMVLFHLFLNYAGFVFNGFDRFTARVNDSVRQPENQLCRFTGNLLALYQNQPVSMLIKPTLQPQLKFSSKTQLKTITLKPIKPVAQQPTKSNSTKAKTAFAASINQLKPETPKTCEQAVKNNIFHVCYFDGIETLVKENLPVLFQADEFPLPSPIASWYGFKHDWNEAGISETGKRDQVTAVWRGRVNFIAGKYVFFTSSDDGVEVELEGFGKVINNWTDHKQTDNVSAKLDLPAGARTITVRWYDNKGPALIAFGWTLLELRLVSSYNR